MRHPYTSNFDLIDAAIYKIASEFLPGAAKAAPTAPLGQIGASPGIAKGVGGPTQAHVESLGQPGPQQARGFAQAHDWLNETTAQESMQHSLKAPYTRPPQQSFWQYHGLASTPQPNAYPRAKPVGNYWGPEYAAQAK